MSNNETNQARALIVTANHAAPDYDSLIKGREFAIVEAGAYGECRIGGDSAHGYYAIAPFLGCGKTCATPERAVRDLLAANGYGAIAIETPAPVEPAPTKAAPVAFERVKRGIIVQELATVELAPIGPVYFERPSAMRMGKRNWHVDFDFEFGGRKYWGTVYADGDVSLSVRLATGYGRELPETQKSDWRAALSLAGRGIIRAARQERAAFVDSGDLANAGRLERGLAPVIEAAPATARDVETLKSKGDYFAAGQLARALGQPRAYGCHYGFRSDLQAATAEFLRGYDSANEPASDEPASDEPAVPYSVPQEADIAGDECPLHVRVWQAAESDWIVANAYAAPLLGDVRAFDSQAAARNHACERAAYFVARHGAGACDVMEIASDEPAAPATIESPLVPNEREAASINATALDMGMNWQGAASLIALALENGTGKGREMARAELQRMAALLDSLVATMGAAQ